MSAENWMSSLYAAVPGRLTWDHQSQEAMPGLTQDVSAIREGEARFKTRSLSTSRPGWRAMMSVRQGERCGITDLTRPCPSGRGESRAARVTAPVLPVWGARLIHMPAQSYRSLSVIATHAPGVWTRSGTMRTWSVGTSARCIGLYSDSWEPIYPSGFPALP